MCNEREKLIGYLYDEGDPTERDAVRRHLETCQECRVEIASLRSVRGDLAAWEVPEHGSVWKPFVAAPAPRWWQHVPQWALAAAAGIVLVSGAVGGAVTHAFISHDAQAMTTAPAGAGAVRDVKEFVALQQQIDLLRAELVAVGDRTQSAAVTPVPVTDDDSHRAFARELAELRMQSERQTLAVESIYANRSLERREWMAKIAGLRDKLDGLTAVLENRSGGQQ
jgi:hypothetical protein